MPALPDRDRVPSPLRRTMPAATGPLEPCTLRIWEGLRKSSSLRTWPDPAREVIFAR